jgi:hypothetical protein
LDWIPVVPESKATDLTAIGQMIAEVFSKISVGPHVEIHLPDDIELKIPPSVVNVTVPEAPPAQVMVRVPESPITINVPEAPAPVVNFTAPAAAKASGPQEVVVTAMPVRKHRAVRNKQGKIEGSVESDQ